MTEFQEVLDPDHGAGSELPPDLERSQVDPRRDLLCEGRQWILHRHAEDGAFASCPILIFC